ncbi:MULTISPECIES: hypothetical protein [Methylobacterium]|uniref:hypothetical protein n=1 Tax=Methylobacterium TaxID=407 RepID=UPI002381C5B2|nr:MULTISPECIES: hypothetical protein [Methylobacterium]MDE4909459.1 hypothetical protein [Methylobacterium sp. 092160098-2]MDH2308482.1 hypothetical protein [Methylobacterium brachiatum]
MFSHARRTIQRDCHVAEVKAERFAALERGASPEAWSDNPHPLRDVTEGDRTQMTVGKFAAIIRTMS